MKSIAFKVVLFGLLCGGSLLADDKLAVDNVRFVSTEGTVKITYDLTGKPDKKYLVGIKLSHDGGQTYSITPETVTGDVGRGIRPGMQKQISWEYLTDFPAGLSGNQYVFEVEAVLQKESKQWMIYVAGTVVGGIVWLVSSLNGDDSSKGQISFTLDAETGF